MFYPPQAATEQGRDIRDLYDIVFFFAAAIFVAVEAAIIFLVWRYRRRDDRLPSQFHGNALIEVVWTAIPLVIVLFLFVLSWQTLEKVRANPARPAGVEIKVVAYQWGWNFEYKHEGLTIAGAKAGSGGPVMVVPVNETIRLQLHSNNVNHAFYVPQFLAKLDVIPQADESRDNIFEFKAEQTGVFRGQCAEFCGLMHHTMVFSVDVRSPADFAAWVAAEKAKPSEAPAATPPAGAVTLEIGADSPISFDKTSLTVAPNTPFVIAFDNRNVGVPHNVHIKDASGKVVFEGKPDVTGPAKAQYVSASGLPAGTYEFFCSIHPNMKGTFEVK